MIGHNCPACRDTGWVGYRRDIGDQKNLPWSGACYCIAGRYLATPREAKAETKRHGEPVVVAHVPRWAYDEALIAARAHA